MTGIYSALSLALLASCKKEGENETVEQDPDDGVKYGFPLLEPGDFYQTVGVDHDPDVYPEGIQSVICTNYDGRGFPWCYDEHKGSDYLLADGFDAMDAGSSEVVAAADGVVVDTDDGHYDRCHSGSNFEVTCDGHEMKPNYVILEHEDGNQTRYLHLLSGSVVVQPGDEVFCGDYLGLVGSSGYSAVPHLHFQLESPDGTHIDPYAGPCSQETSYWSDQGPSDGFPGPGCVSDS